MEKIKRNFVKNIKIVLGVIGLISGLMTIDGWVKDRYYQESQQMKVEQKYYIYGDVVIDKTYEQRELE